MTLDEALKLGQQACEYRAASIGNMAGKRASLETVTYLIEAAAALERLRAELPKVLDAARLRRNAIMVNSSGFFGEWVAVPNEDFEHLRTILSRLEQEDGGGA